MFSMAQNTCCNASFSSSQLPQSSGLYTFEFVMGDSMATDIQFVQWAFGDGTYSNDRTPVHSYNYTGDYSVVLTVFKQMIDNVQKSCTETHVLSVTGTCSNFINFKSNKTVSFIQTAAFDIDSTSAWATSRTFVWTFGDGQTSNQLNPSHTYAQVGTYNVCLYQYRNDLGFQDSCYTCQTIVVQDTTSQPVTCSAVYSYQVIGSRVNVLASDSIHPSYWWISGDTTTFYGSTANFIIPSDSGLTICHRQYTGPLTDTNYCEECYKVYSNTPIDTIPVNCNADFSYSLTDSLVSVQANVTMPNSYWWLKQNGIRLPTTYFGNTPYIIIPASGEITVCHAQYNNSALDSCLVCKVVRAAKDSIHVTPCYSDFNYTVSGNTIYVHTDSLNYGTHIWNFANESIRLDSAITSYSFTSPGMKRVCQTTNVFNYYRNAYDSCTTCKDILIDPVSVTISPNPAQHKLNVHVADGLISSIDIYNINGEVVKNIPGLNTSDFVVHVANLSTGMYYAMVVLHDGRSSKTPIVIQ